MQSRTSSPGSVRRLTSLLLAAAAFAPFATAQEDGAQATLDDITNMVTPDNGESVFGEPVYVNGERVSDLMIKRYLVYGPGRGILEMYKRQALIDDQIARAKADASANGEELDPFKFEVTEEDWNRKYDERVGKFAIQFPFLDLETELRRAYGSIELFERAEQQMLQFDKVFLPRNPYEWPVITVEAIRPEADGMVLQDAYKTYETRKRMAEESGDEMKAEGDVYMNFLRDLVETALIGTMDVMTYSDGIDPNLALIMDDGDGSPELTVTLDQIYDELTPYLDPVQVDQVKLFCAKIVAARQQLEAGGALIPMEEFKKEYEEMAGQSTHFFTMESVALYTDYFPSIEHFKAYLHLSMSFERMIGDLMEAPEGERLSAELKEHLAMANKIMGLAKVEGEVLMCSAFDTPAFEWKADGWNQSKEHATYLKMRYDENLEGWRGQQQAQLEAARDGNEFTPDPKILNPYEFWTTIREEHCEYWDAPPPLDGDGSSGKDGGSNVSYRNKGKWGEKTRHDLQTFVGESHFISWVQGQSVADHLFFDQEVGSVEGPFKGPQGWYLTHVVKRMPPTHPLRVNDDNHVNLLKQSYGRAAFVEYCNDALQTAEVQGIDK